MSPAMSSSNPYSNPTRLMPGDIVLTGSSSIMGRLIRWGETSPRETKSYFNHASLLVAAPAIIVESAWHVRRCSLWDYHSDDRIVAYRPPYANAEERLYVIAYAGSWVGKKYPVGHLFSYLIDNKIFRGRTVTRRLLPGDKGVCSSLVTYALREVGMYLGKDEPDPDDIHDYCRTHSNLFPVVFYQAK